MGEKTELAHAGEFLVSEGNGTISRDKGTVTVPASSTLQAGTVLGQLSADDSFVQYDNAETDGREDAAGVLYNELVNEDTEEADVEATVIVRDAEVREDDLIFEDGTSAEDIAAALVDLKALGIIAR